MNGTVRMLRFQSNNPQYYCKEQERQFFEQHFCGKFPAFQEVNHKQRNGQRRSHCFGKKRQQKEQERQGKESFPVLGDIFQVADTKKIINNWT
jgi:hypothetical protein